MAMMRYNFFSQVLNLCTDVTITYPDRQFNYSKMHTSENINAVERNNVLTAGMRLQTLYVLHGGSDDDSLIHRYTNIERYADDNCLMTVTAQVKDSFFIDTEYGFRYYTFMTEELPSVMQCLFASSSRREDNFVLGMAMGGNAALMLAMKRPDLYQAVVDLSGGIGCCIDSEYFENELIELSRMRRLSAAFGDPKSARNGDWDIGKLAREHYENKTQVPDISIAVGETDFIRDVVRKDRDALQKIGYKIRYHEEPGLGHEWEFWDKYIKKAIYEWLPLKRSACREN